MRGSVAAAVALAHFTDDGQRANETPLSKSGAWSTPTSLGTVNLASNIFTGATGGENMARLTGTFHGDQSAALAWVAGTFVGACVRMDAAGQCYTASTNTNSQIQVLKITGSAGAFSYTALGAEIVLGVNLNAGDIIKISATGTTTTTLLVYVNGVLIGTRTDSSSPFTTGKPAMRNFGGDAFGSSFEAFEL